MPHGGWIATRLSVFVGAYNTNIIKPADAPKSYEDLRDPKWKGKLGIEADDANWFLSVVGFMGEQKGLQLFHDIVATNGMSIRKGHTLLANFVGSGEVPLALTAYSYRVEQMKNVEGAPVEILYLPPVVALPTGAGVFKRAPHPNAALLLAGFLPDRCPENPGGSGGGRDRPARQGAAEGPDLRRPAEIPRRGRQVDEAVPGNLRQPGPLNAAQEQA